jgi:hypothetical protein
VKHRFARAQFPENTRQRRISHRAQVS